MSQIIKNLSSGPVPPSVPTSFVTDSGTAVPAANVLNDLGNTSTSNNNNGITTTGSGNTVTTLLTNRIGATTTTVNATLTTIATFSLGAIPGVFSFEGRFSGFIPASGRGGTYFFEGSARTDGATATEIGSDVDVVFEDVAMAASDVFFTTSGNNVLLQVQGILGATINWRVLSDYTFVS